MDFAWIPREDGCCLLCVEWAKRWYVVVECEVVLRLWQRLGGVVGVWGDATVGRVEMALSVGGTGPGTVIRNRLSFTPRSVVHRMRGLHVGGIEVTVDCLWSLFLR